MKPTLLQRGAVEDLRIPPLIILRIRLRRTIHRHNHPLTHSRCINSNFILLKFRDIVPLILRKGHRILL